MEQSNMMNDGKMGAAELRFADIIWENEPVSSPRLAEISGQKLGWKKSTVYTVLKRLCEKGFFRNEDGTVSSLVSRNDYYARQSEKFVEENFEGSLPAFLAAFTSRKKLTCEEYESLKKMIDGFGEGK